MSDPVDGSYTIDLHQGYTGDVFVVAFDDMGQQFEANAPISVGEIIHPTVFAGYVFECDGAGTLPETEPTWNNDLENSHVYGTASLRATPFYRPQVHGPITPEFIGPQLVNATHWRVRSTKDKGAGLNWITIAYIRFLTQTGWSNTLSFTQIASGELDPAWGKGLAFDPSLASGNRWISDPLPAWIGCIFSEAQSVLSVEISPNDQTTHLIQMPGDLFIEYSTDTGVTWETIASFASIDAWAAATPKTFIAQSP
jgi:hypothetical protein